MTLSDLAKYWVTWSIARPFCDSSVYCFLRVRPFVYPSVRSYVTLPNLWTRTNRSYCKLAQYETIKGGGWGGRRSRSHDVEVRFWGMAEPSFAWVGFLVAASWICTCITHLSHMYKIACVIGGSCQLDVSRSLYAINLHSRICGEAGTPAAIEFKTFLRAAT